MHGNYMSIYTAKVYIVCTVRYMHGMLISLEVRTKQVIKVMRDNDKGGKKYRFKISVSIG